MSKLDEEVGTPGWVIDESAPALPIAIWIDGSINMGAVSSPL